jgi:hypothetical protein
VADLLRNRRPRPILVNTRGLEGAQDVLPINGCAL